MMIMEERREFETSNGKFVLQRLPDDIRYNLGIGENNILFGDTNDSSNWNYYSTQLQQKAKIIGFVSSLTEEKCKEVVDYRQRIFFYPDYTHFIQPNYFYSFAISSFKSLCESLNVDVTQNWLLIKLL